MKTLKVKIIALIVLVWAISDIAFAQTANVPQNVQAAFSSKFPQAQLKNWKMERGQYVASFVMDKRACEATYAPDGNWVSTLTIYNHMFKHLNPEIRDELRNSMYASYHIDQVKNLEMPTMDMYLLTVDNDNGNMSAYENAGSVDMETLYFNHNGRLIKSISNSNQ